MMGYNTKNYSEQGGDKWVIGGTLEILPDAEIIGLDVAPATGTKIGGVKAEGKNDEDTVEVKIGPDSKLYVPPTNNYPVAENQPESAASTPQEIVDDLNALLQKLKVAGIMAADE